jgi:hypothetical protein
MRRALAILLAVALLLAPVTALAQDARRLAKPKPESAPVTTAAPAAVDPCPTPPEDFDPIPVEIGEPVPRCGILISEPAAAAQAKCNNELQAVKLKLEVRAGTWDAKQQLFETNLQAAQTDRDKWRDAYVEERNGWWNRNGNAVALTAGVVVGIVVALAAGAVWAQVKENN